MKAEELKTKSMDELKKLLIDLKQQHMTMRFQKAGGQLANTAQMRNVRREVARIKTVMEQLAGGKTAAPKAKGKAKAGAKTAKKTKAA